MKNRLLCVMLSLYAGATWAGSLCFPVGTTLTIEGVPVQQSAETDDGSSQPVWILSMNPPLCVIDKRFSDDPQGRVMVAQAQLVGRPFPTGVTLAVTGTVMRRSTPPYFILPKSVWVVPPTKVAPQ